VVGVARRAISEQAHARQAFRSDLRDRHAETARGLSDGHGIEEHGFDHTTLAICQAVEDRRTESRTAAFVRGRVEDLTIASGDGPAAPARERPRTLVERHDAELVRVAGERSIGRRARWKEALLNEALGRGLVAHHAERKRVENGCTLSDEATLVSFGSRSC